MNLVDLKGKTIFITGFQKECGKTTILNYLIHNISDSPKGYFSIGIESEKQDATFPNLKSQVYAKEKDIILSDNSYFFSDCQCKIINSYNNGQTLMLEVLRPGYVSLTNIGENSRISEIIEDMKRAKCRTILIDGAFDRITQVSSIENSHFIYVVKVTPDNFNSAIDKINLIFSMFKIPIIKENAYVFKKMQVDFFRNNDNIFIKGAITNSKLKKIDYKGIKNIFFEDFTKIFLDYSAWEKLVDSKKIYFCSKFNFIGFVVNLQNVSQKDFESGLKNDEVKNYLNYNLYEYK